MTTAQPPAYFVGSYVRKMTEVLIASLLSRQNAIILGAPGCGKTSICRAMANVVVNGQFSFMEIEPSTPPERVFGLYDPKAIINDGEFVRVTKDTPYDPDTQVVILDEAGRANEPTFDALIHALERHDTDTPPPAWATSNFMPTQERVAALIDRFSLWFWVEPDAIDIEEVAMANMLGIRPTIDPATVPTRDEVDRVWSTIPTHRAMRAVAAAARQLGDEAKSQGRYVHNRRVAQWSKILLRLSIYYEGSGDFAVVPDKALNILRYCWPATSPEEAASWAEIAGSVVDPVGEAIEFAKANVLKKMQEIAALTAAERRAESSNLYRLMQSAQEDMMKVAGPDDPRIEEASVQMNTWMSNLMRGKPVE